MATRQKKLEKHRQRRQVRRRELRLVTEHRDRSLLSSERPLYACYSNRDWRTDGMASIFLARSAGPGLVNHAAFLVDHWGLGLKDTWGSKGIAIGDFEETVERMRAQTAVSPLPVETARHLVYGGIKMARDLGFRLPRHHERWLPLLGPLPTGQSPDMSLFGKDGKTHIWCSTRDLELRYLGDPRKLLARKDLEFVIVDSESSLLDGEMDDDGADDHGDDLLAAVPSEVSRWCARHGVPMHPYVPAAIPVLLNVTIQVIRESAETFGPDDEVPLSPAAAEAIVRRAELEMHRQGYEPKGANIALMQVTAALKDADPPE